MSAIEWANLVKLAKTKAPDEVMRINAGTVLAMASAIIERDATIKRLQTRKRKAIES